MAKNHTEVEKMMAEQGWVYSGVGRGVSV